jgi:hypothetical protein
VARTASAGSHRPLPIADLDHGLPSAAVALGAIGLALIALDLEVVGTMLGVVGMVVALWGQMISRTRGERFVDMAGLLVSFLALAVGASQGGLPL